LATKAGDWRDVVIRLTAIKWLVVELPGEIKIWNLTGSKVSKFLFSAFSLAKVSPASYVAWLPCKEEKARMKTRLPHALVEGIGREIVAAFYRPRTTSAPDAEPAKEQCCSFLAPPRFGRWHRSSPLLVFSW
jgi:hypothetical protein